jgi:hypothetical protein
MNRPMLWLSYLRAQVLLDSATLRHDGIGPSVRSGAKQFRGGKSSRRSQIRWASKAGGAHQVVLMDWRLGGVRRNDRGGEIGSPYPLTLEEIESVVM